MLQLLASRVEPSGYQKSVLEQLDTAAGTDEKEVKVKGKRHPKGPNPLSVKKSTKTRHSGKSLSLGDTHSRNRVCIVVLAVK